MNNGTSISFVCLTIKLGNGEIRVVVVVIEWGGGGLELLKNLFSPKSSTDIKSALFVPPSFALIS